MHPRQALYQLGYIPKALTHPCPYPLTHTHSPSLPPSHILLLGHRLPATHLLITHLCLWGEQSGYSCVHVCVDMTQAHEEGTQQVLDARLWEQRQD